MMTTFHDRLAAALRRRLFPHTGLQIKQVAGAIGQDGRNLSRWINGESKPFAEATDALARFFASRGDHAFLPEVYGIEAPKPEPVNVPAPSFSADQCFWVTDEFHAAPYGHQEFARRFLGASPLVEVDLCALMMRTQGAVAITARSDGSVIARYSERGIDPAAASRAREWFHANAGLTNITRAVEIDDQWVEGRHTGPNAAASAAAAFDGAAPISARARHFDHEIARLPLSYVTDERMVRMLSAVSQTKAEPGYLRDLAAGLNLMDSVALLRVCNNQITSTWAGRRLGVNAQAVIGRDLSERADLRYAETLRQHIHEPINDNAPVFRDLRISIDGRGHHYQRIAIAEPADQHGVRFVLTMPKILQSEGIAA